LCHLKARAKEGGDALRSPQTHPKTRPAPTTRTKRRPRRVPPRGRRSEPPQTRQADPTIRPNPGHVSRAPSSGVITARRYPFANLPKTDFFNTIAPKQPFARITPPNVRLEGCSVAEPFFHLFGSSTRTDLPRKVSSSALLRKRHPRSRSSRARACNLGPLAGDA